MIRTGRLIAAASCVYMAGAYAADAAQLAGRVIDDETGRGVGRVMVRAYAHGRGISHGVLTEGDGSFHLRDLEPGTYAVCVPGGEGARPLTVPAVTLNDEEPATIHLRVMRSWAVDGDSWVQPYTSFCQSFRATGLGVTIVGIKAFGAAHPVRVTLLEGEGPGGEMISPPRVSAPAGHEDTKGVFWAGGEAATVPGRVYTLQMTSADGEPWVPGLAGRGDVLAEGSAWFDGSARPHSDLGIFVCEDNDGMRTDYAVSGDWRTFRARSMGQTFIALSRSITYASAVLSGVTGPPVYARFSIHENGPGGRQIGPSKGVQAAEDAAVAWGASEIPVVPGKRYYLHIESFGGSRFLATVQPDTYAPGTAVLDGEAHDALDLSAVVAGQISDADYVRLIGHPAGIETITLANPSFEEGITGWHRSYGEMGAVVGCDGGIAPAWGERMFGWTNRGTGGNSRPTIYQKVKVKPGGHYRFSGSVVTDHVGGRSSDVKVRLVVAPGGGDDLRDYDRVTSSQWYATEGQWCRGSVEFVSESGEITVGFELEQRFDLDSSSVYVDGAYLERIRTTTD